MLSQTLGVTFLFSFSDQLFIFMGCGGVLMARPFILYWMNYRKFESMTQHVNTSNYIMTLTN